MDSHGCSPPQADGTRGLKRNTDFRPGGAEGKGTCNAAKIAAQLRPPFAAGARMHSSECFTGSAWA